jgi:hypothetical protein
MLLIGAIKAIGALSPQAYRPALAYPVPQPFTATLPAHATIMGIIALELRFIGGRIDRHEADTGAGRGIDRGQMTTGS